MRLLLAEYFRRLGFTVEERESGAEALEPATSGRFDCFIFDVTMPEMTGLELLRRVRERGVQTPAMFLTAHDEVEAKVAGFEAGADDYLVKPFDLAELVARVRALLRRARGRSVPVIRHGALEFDPAGLCVRRGARTIALSAREGAILTDLFEQRGVALSRARLKKACMAGTRKSTATPSNSISTTCAKSTGQN